MILLLAAALPLALATQGEMLITRDVSGVKHYLQIKSLGRKNLFGEAEWSIKRGTALRWQWETDQTEDPPISKPNNKIQVLGKFKKKNLCLYWRGNYAQPFNVKSCSGAFADGSNALRFGCTAQGSDKYFGKLANVGDTSKMQHDIGAEWEVMDYSDVDDVTKLSTKIKKGQVCDHPTLADVAGPIYDEEAYKASNFEVTGSFTLMTDKDGDARWFGVRQSKHDLDANGNAGGDVWAWSATKKKGAKAAVLQWKGDYIQVIGPSHARTDGKPLCLKLDKSKSKISGMPLRVQKCDNTIEDGKFACHDSKDGNTYFGMKWNAKKLAEAESSKCPHEDVLSELLNQIQKDERKNCEIARKAKEKDQKSRMRTQFYAMKPGQTVADTDHGPCYMKDNGPENAV